MRLNPNVCNRPFPNGPIANIHGASIAFVDLLRSKSGACSTFVHCVCERFPTVPLEFRSLFALRFSWFRFLGPVYVGDPKYLHRYDCYEKKYHSDVDRNIASGSRSKPIHDAIASRMSPTNANGVAIVSSSLAPM